MSASAGVESGAACRNRAALPPGGVAAAAPRSPCRVHRAASTVPWLRCHAGDGLRRRTKGVTL